MYSVVLLCVCMCMCMHTCTHVKSEVDSGYLPLLLPTLVYEAGSLTEPRAYHLGQDGQGVPRLPLSCFIILNFEIRSEDLNFNSRACPARTLYTDPSS